MEKLVKNISKLIAQHNCVIMPGIGAFLAHRVPAYYSAKEKVFMPPHRELGFNPQVIVDDALLLSEYMGDGLLSYEEANEYLTKDIDSLRSKLSSNGTVCFGDLGIFTMDIDGQISFTPNDNCIDDPYNYGFEPLAISPLKELKKKDIVIKRNSISKYVSAIAAAIILIFVLVPIGNSIYNSDIQLSVAGFTPVDVNVKPSVPSMTENLECEIAPVEETVTPHIYTLPASVQNTAVSVTEEPQQLQEVNEEIPVSSDTANLSKEASKQYSIIVASTPNPQNAQLAITELSRKMKADYQVVEGDRRFRIAIESYDNESDANAALERIQATFSDAWVYIH